MAVETRHVAARGLIKFNNVIGWICVISILLLPIGLIMLVQGHLCLALIETEENTRSVVDLLSREYIKVKNVG